MRVVFALALGCACAPVITSQPILTVTDRDGRTMHCVQTTRSAPPAATFLSGFGAGMNGQPSPRLPSSSSVDCWYEPLPPQRSAGPPQVNDEGQAADYETPR